MKQMPTSKELGLTSKEPHTLIAAQGAPATPIAPQAPLVGHMLEEVKSVSFSPDGERIVSGSGDNTLRLWEVEEQVAPAPSQPSTFSLSTPFELKKPSTPKEVSSSWSLGTLSPSSPGMTWGGEN